MNEHKSLSVGPIIALVVLSIVVLVVFVVLPNVMQPATTDVQLGSGIFHATVATNDADRVKGLSDVTTLNSDQALLMAFPSEDKWGIWMKDMKVPIDILWLNKDKKVIYIVKGASPSDSTSKVFKPKTPAKYVVELPSGSVDLNAIKTNSLVIFQINEGNVK
jgi:uncharacterized membrane protein (UPF0127 family)